MKKTAGFSYLEILIALALFAIVLIAIVPALTQAGRNMVYAEGAYDSHLQAQRVMLVVRDALIDNADPVVATSSFIGSIDFSFWVRGQNGINFHPRGEPEVDIAAIGSNYTINYQANTIIVVVWSEDGYIAGRAIGMLYP